MTQFSAVNVPTIVCIYVVLQHYSSLQSAPAPGVFSSDHSTGGSTAAPCSRKPSHNWQQAVRVFTHCKLSTVHCCEELRQLWLINTDTTLSPSPAPACESCHGTSHLILGTFYSFYLNKWMLPQVCSSTGAGQAGGVCGQAAGHGILRPAPRSPVLSSSPLKLARPSPDFSMMF